VTWLEQLDSETLPPVSIVRGAGLSVIPEVGAERFPGDAPTNVT
jgi:hypothetical protein